MADPAREAYEKLGDTLDSIPFNRAHGLLIFMVALGALFDAVEQYNVGYVAPILRDLWGISETQVGLLATFTFGGLAVGALIAGVVGDKVGRKITYMYNLALFTFGALICAFAPNIEVLLAGRFIVGIGLGGELNTGLTMVSEFVSTRARGSAVAVVNIAAGGLGIFISGLLAFVILGPLGPLLGGEDVAWRWVLGILALPAVLLFVYRLYIPESPRFLLSRGRLSELNVVLSLLEHRTLRRTKLPRTEEYFTSAGGALAPERVVLSEILRGHLARRTIGIWIISLMTFGAQVAITVFFPTVLVEQGFTVVTSVLYTTIINIGGLIGAVLASVFAAKLPRRAVLGFGAIVAVAVALVYGTVESTPMILLGGALMQLMFILLNTTTWLYTPELYPTRVRAFGTGAAVTVALIGATVMPLIGGAIFGRGGVVALFTMVAIMYVVMAITVFLLKVETKGRSLDELSEGHVVPEAATV